MSIGVVSFLALLVLGFLLGWGDKLGI